VRVLLLALGILSAAPAASDTNPTSPEIRQAQELLRAGMFKMLPLARKAEAAFARAVELDPDFLDARFALMEFHLMAPGVLGGSVDTARNQAVEIRRRESLAGHRAFAALAVAEKDLDGARNEHLAALEEQPGPAAARYWYGVFLMITTKEYEAAREQFAAALALDPGYRAAQFQIGHVAALSGTSLDEGKAALLEYLEHEPGPSDLPLYRAHYWLGLLNERLGDRPAARRHLEEARKIRPNDKETRKALARL
jgi:tetratricopeptide (TPR) repeat protein